jgi:hypothetical protein
VILEVLVKKSTMLLYFEEVNLRKTDLTAEYGYAERDFLQKETKRLTTDHG